MPLLSPTRLLGIFALLTPLLAAALPCAAAMPSLPAEVRAAAAAAREEAARAALPPSSPAALLPPLGDPEPEGPPGIYGNAVLGALARAMGGEEGLFQTGLRQLSQGETEAAAGAFAEVRTRYAAGERRDDAAFWLAEALRRQGRLADAAAVLALAGGKRKAEADYRRGWLLFSTGRTADAARAWEGPARDPAGPYRFRAAAALGATLVSLGDADGARSLLTEATRAPRPPADPEDSARYAALLPLGLARLLLGETPQAERALLQLLLDRPDHPAAPAAHDALGWALLREGSEKEALRHFTKAAAPGVAEELADRARLGVALARLDLGEPGPAADALWALGRRQPWTDYGALALAWHFFQQGQPESALLWAGTAAEALPAPSPLAAYLTAESLRLLGRNEEAERAYGSVPAATPLGAAALHGKALAALATGRGEDACALLAELLRDRPEYSGADAARFVLAEESAALGRLEDARRAAEDVSGPSPRFPDALLLRASLASTKGRWAETAGLLDRFLGSFPEDPRAERALLQRVRAERERGSPKAALDLLDAKARRLVSPEAQTDGRIERGRLLVALGRDEEARPLLEKELEAAEGTARAPLVHELLGEVDARGGKLEAALDHFEKTLAAAPGSEAGRAAALGRARSLYGLGRTEEALQRFREVGDTADGVYGRALCLARLARPEEVDELARAVAAFTRLDEGEHDPRGPELARLLAESRLAAARHWLREGQAAAGRALPLLASAAAHPGPAGAEALAETARYYEEHGSAEEARDAWDRLAARASGADRAEALRAAARQAERAGDAAGAADRLGHAAEACPRDRLELRQALLADLGELDLREGKAEDAAKALRTAADAGMGPEGLRALRALVEAQQTLGRKEEALETSLRIGYLYGLENPGAAEPVVRAAAELESAGSPGRAFALYQWAVRSAPQPWSDRAKGALDRLAAAREPRPPEPPSPAP